MKIKVKLILFTILVSGICSCSSHNTKFGSKTSDIIISGEILNFATHRDHQTIQIICRDFFDRQKSYSSTIDTNGHFRINFLSVYPQEFYLNYGKLVSVFCRPGDSLFIEIDADIFNESDNEYPHGVFFCRFPDNELGRTNKEINKFKEDLPDDNYSNSKANEAERDKLPDDYKEFVKEREVEYSDFLNSYITKNKTTSLFKKWADDHLKYEPMNDLMRYRWTHSEYNQDKTDTFRVPDRYFSFLNDYNMDDTDLFSISHIDFLHELSMYSKQNPTESRVKANRAINEKDFRGGVEILTSMIKLHTTGFTRDLFLTQFYYNILKGQQLDIFEAVFDSAYTQHPYFLKIINTEYSDLRKYLSNQNTSGANIVTLKSAITADLIDSIVVKYKNKVIYIDFWAPWCSPCMAEMPSSIEIQSYFKNKDVVFLFLANRCKEDSWKATIANQKITGEHILLTDDQFNVLSSILGIGGIPHYTLINKSGIIVIKNAPRPSDKKGLITEIEKLLAK